MKTSCPSTSRGFTLIEMIVTLCIFILLASAVFTLFGATLQSATALQDDLAQSDQTEALGEWLSNCFLDLPPNGQITSLRREGTPFDVSDVIWGTADQLSALDLHLQANGLYTLRLAESTAGIDPSAISDQAATAGFSRKVLTDDPSLAWRNLMRDLKTADWRFRTPTDSDWQEAAPGNRQNLIQFTFQLAASRKSVVDDCWIPPIVAPPGLVLPTPTNVTANP